MKSGVKIYLTVGKVYRFYLNVNQGIAEIKRLKAGGYTLTGVGTESGQMVVHFHA